MLGCCAGICGGTAARSSASKTVAEQDSHAVVKPTLRVEEAYAPDVTSVEALGSFGLEPAPPGVDPPLVAVTEDYTKNPWRLLVILPSPDASWGMWDTALSGGQGAAVPITRWARANNYAVALFNAAAFAASPAETWDKVLKANPSRFVAALVASRAEPLFRTALSATHSLLYSRLRVVTVAGPIAPFSEGCTPDLEKHLTHTIAPVPPEWMQLNAFAMHQCLFQLLEERVDRWQKTEIKKYAGFQSLKENDVPGLKRMPLDTRVQRLNRDRGDDELARLLEHHEKAARGVADIEEDEPGVD